VSRARRAAGLVAACVVAGGLAGCAATPPLGTVERPEVYPDRTSALACWETFAWAWKTGDVEVLEQVTGGWLRWELDKQLEKNSREAVAEYYRGGARDLVVLEADWVHLGEALAYLHVVLSAAAVPRVEVDFALTARGLDDWVVTGRRSIR
jgi:hypothetical protein